MTLQRASVKGTIGGIVQTRNIFTCDVVESGGDTYQILWEAYLDNVYSGANQVLSNIFAVYAYELFNYSAGHWIPFLEQAWAYPGTISGDPLPNAVSFVLLGKALGLRHVGRKFFSPLPENYVVGNALVGAGITAAALTLLAYITPFTGIGGGTITPGVVDNGGTFHPFVGGVVSSLLGSMRRRKPGLGI